MKEEDDFEGKKVVCPEDRLDAVALALLAGRRFDLPEWAVRGEIYAGRTTDCPPCQYVYGVDLASGPDMTVTAEYRDGEFYRIVVIDPINDYMRELKAPTELMLKEPKRDHDRPWVAMKRKPWERRR